MSKRNKKQAKLKNNKLLPNAVIRKKLESFTPKGSASNDSLIPDYGTHYLKQFGLAPMLVNLSNFSVMITEKEGYIMWEAHGFLATLIVPKTFAEYHKGSSFIGAKVVPDPADAYTTPLGERVVPFKLAH